MGAHTATATARGGHVPIVIVGAGFAGLAVAARLRRAGIEDFTILERADTIGGVWRENTYPGCACDVPSALYSLSFAPNPDWSRAFAPQPEIRAYLQRVARDHALDGRIRFGVELLDARWDETRHRWRCSTSAGPLTAGVLVSAMGPFGGPVIPDIPGRDTFAGTSFHSACWDHAHELRGRRVAVVGTGASAIQFVPQIQPEVAQLLVFQRTPPWVLPRMDFAVPRALRALFKVLPPAQRSLRGLVFTMFEALGLANFVHPRLGSLHEALARAQLRRQVADPGLRSQLTPDYTFGCKRALVSDNYLPALTRDNVEVVTGSIASISADGVVTADGVLHPVDTIIWGTGFEVPTGRLSVIHGRDGRSIIDLYNERPQSYLGTTLAGFPNFFMVLGPWGTSGNQSAVFMIECAARYIIDAITTMRARGIATVDVRRDAQDRFVTDVERRSQRTVWVNGGCRSYYLTPDGRNAGLWPNWSATFARRTRRFDYASYAMTHGPSTTEEAHDVVVAGV